MNDERDPVGHRTGDSVAGEGTTVDDDAAASPLDEAASALLDARLDGDSSADAVAAGDGAAVAQGVVGGQQTAPVAPPGDLGRRADAMASARQVLRDDSDSLPADRLDGMLLDAVARAGAGRPPELDGRRPATVTSLAGPGRRARAHRGLVVAGAAAAVMAVLAIGSFAVVSGGGGGDDSAAQRSPGAAADLAGDAGTESPARSQQESGAASPAAPTTTVVLPSGAGAEAGAPDDGSATPGAASAEPPGVTQAAPGDSTLPGTARPVRGWLARLLDTIAAAAAAAEPSPTTAATAGP